MYNALKSVTLQTGETVEAAVIRGPDATWAERIEKMLLHKGDPWNWQNTELLRQQTGAKASFFILHREGVPFSNIMLVEAAGVGLLAHVWTEVPDRRAGASSLLMELLLQEFDRSNGRAIFLGTDYDTPQFKYYQRRRFETIEPNSGYMGRYAQSREEFERTWFDVGDSIIEPLDWVHLPLSSPLFLGNFGGAVRVAASQLIGRICEGPLLPLIRHARQQRLAGKAGGARVLRGIRGTAMLGLAGYYPHPLWPNTDVLDVFCHPRWWHQVPALLHSMPASTAERVLAYCDSSQLEKCAILEEIGFRKTAILPQWVAANAQGHSRLDVLVLVRQ